VYFSPSSLLSPSSSDKASCACARLAAHAADEFRPASNSDRGRRVVVVALLVVALALGGEVDADASVTVGGVAVDFARMSDGLEGEEPGSMAAEKRRIGGDHDQAADAGHQGVHQLPYLRLSGYQLAILVLHSIWLSCCLVDGNSKEI
jgi:hypothetical protein